MFLIFCNDNILSSFCLVVTFWWQYRKEYYQNNRLPPAGLVLDPGNVQLVAQLRRHPGLVAVRHQVILTGFFLFYCWQIWTVKPLYKLLKAYISMRLYFPSLVCFGTKRNPIRFLIGQIIVIISGCYDRSQRSTSLCVVNVFCTLQVIIVFSL